MIIFVAKMFVTSVRRWLCALIVTLIPGCDDSVILSEPAGAPLSPPGAWAEAAEPPARMTLNPASGHVRLGTVNNSLGLGMGGERRSTVGAIYSRQELLQLRAPRHKIRPPSDAVSLMHKLGIARKRRGIRGGRKSRRPIRVITTERPPRSTSAARRSSVLSRPARLTEAETRAISRPPPPPPTPRGRLLLCHANVRSLTAHYEEVTALIETHKPELVCLSETWLTDSVLDSYLVFNGYKLHRQDRTVPRKSNTTVRGGGVAILSSVGLKTERLNIKSTDPATDSLWLMVTYRGSSAMVGVLYRPPGSTVSRFIDSLRDQLLDALASGKPVFLLGDVNIDVSRPSSSGVAAYTALLNELNLHQLVDRPTHLQPTPTILDHVVTNQPDTRASVAVLSEAIGDHQPVTCSAALPKVRRKPEYRETRRWDRADWSAICLDFLLADWEPVFGAIDVDTKLDEFMLVWDAVIDRHCPKVRTRSAPLGCPWLRENPDLQALMAERDAAHTDWQQYRTEEDHTNYRRLHNQVKSGLARARRDFLCDQLAHQDHRGFWQRLKQFAVRSSAVGNEDASVLGQERADTFNEYFSSVGARVASELRADVDDESEMEQRAPRPVTVCSSAFTLKPVTLPELSVAIRGMSGSKAVGLDGVPINAVRKCFPVVGPVLLNLINCTIRTGVFPSKWKVALVVPLHKSGDVGIAKNYRPISLLSVLSKITERVVCNQLTGYLSENKILSDAQFAYRRGHSVEDALIDALDWVTKRIDSGHIVSITALDLSKAFDSVNHSVLLSKMGWYGIASDWFASYLTDRRQMVRGGTSVLPVTCGVPQGSIVGPILFCLTVNEIQNFLPHGRLISYADDTQLFDSSPKDSASMTSLRNRLKESLMSIEMWLRVNSLKMNPSKTEFSLLGTRQAVKENSDFHFEVSDNKITPSKTIKVLGVMIDQCLTWESHVSLVVRRCTGILVSLYRFRRHFTTEALITVIHAHVFSHIMYCLPVWAGASSSQLKRIQKVIHFAARVVTGARRYDHMSPVLRSLGWLSIEAVITERDCTRVFRALNDPDAPSAIRRLFSLRRDTASRDTRLAHSNQLDLPRARLAATQRTFSYRAATSWNSLPETVLQSSSIEQFKSKLRAMHVA